MSEAEKNCKLLLIGTEKAGKTAFLFRYCDNTFVEEYRPTVGIDFKAKNITRDGEVIAVRLWDTSGDKRYQAITTAYYREAKGFIVVMDLTNENSLQEAKKKVAEAKKSESEAKMILVGNKSDLTESRAITKEQGLELAQSEGIEYFETSVKNGINITEVIDKLLDLIYPKSEPEPEKKPEDVTPKEPAEKPKEPAEKPKEPAEKPKEPAEKPKEPAEKPKEPAEKPKEPAEKPKEKEPTPEKKPDPVNEPNVQTVPDKPTKPIDTNANSCWSTGTLLFIGCACVAVICAWYFSKDK